MLLALVVPVLVGVFLLAMERFEAWAFGPLDGSGPQVIASQDRDLRPRPPGVTALLPVPRSPEPSGTRVDDVRRNADETDVHRQGSGRPIEGRVPWT
ncbi:MAG: hypothetical protein ACXVXT_13755 [Blastococcus sp.]